MGLYSAKYAYFAAPHDLVSPGLENVWIAEVGSASLNGTFDSFKKTLSDSLVREANQKQNPGKYRGKICT